MPFGVDEAGKGPALGSMFAAAVHVADPDALPEGIADSKRLAPARREELAAHLADDERVAVGVAEIDPDLIDDPKTDMNSLAVRAHAEAIEEALTNADGLENAPTGCCDACDTDAKRFARRVADACALDLNLAAEHGADDDDPIVGAASIVAKVERDAQMAALAAEYGSVGSGYPSDPTTREFMESFVRETGELPPFARESWSTCADVLADAQQTGLGQF